MVKDVVQGIVGWGRSTWRVDVLVSSSHGVQPNTRTITSTCHLGEASNDQHGHWSQKG